MEELRRHEIFEIEALEALKNNRFLEPLVFGGGTMLRLCYELNRYSTDLDFWIIKKLDTKAYFNKLKKYLAGIWELTDACVKFNTLLFEIRSQASPKRLIIEIRKEFAGICDYQEKIAFSKYSTKQVLLKTFTLEQMMKNKISAALERKDIRDFFDIEFLLRLGVKLECAPPKFQLLREIVSAFKEKDFKVTLGSVLEADTRQYYLKNKFEYLLSRGLSFGKS
jgi:predicted nucleotidyltransferase component of viral defense system